MKRGSSAAPSADTGQAGAQTATIDVDLTTDPGGATPDGLGGGYKPLVTTAPIGSFVRFSGRIAHLTVGDCTSRTGRLHQIATLFGRVTVRLPRLLCSGGGRIETGVSWPSHCRSTPELDQLQAHLSALMPYRVAAGVLEHLLPVEAGKSPETLRGHTLEVGEQLRNVAADKPAAAASTISITLDSTFIRSCHDGDRHLEVRVGNLETPDGGRQVFGAIARTDTDIAVLIRRSLETAGRTDDTELTAFTDGCPGLRSILADAGVTNLPILDWFRHTAPAREASGDRIVDRRAGSDAGEDSDRRGGRTPALADLERQGQECPAHYRAHPQGHAGLQGRARPPHDGRAIPQAAARVARGRQLSQQPKHLARQLRRTISCRLACRDFGYRRYSELPGQSAHEQIATNAMVSTRCRPAAAGPLRGLQRRARFRVGPSVRTCLPPTPAIGEGAVIPPISGHSPDQVTLPPRSCPAVIATVAVLGFANVHAHVRSWAFVPSVSCDWKCGAMGAERRPRRSEIGEGQRERWRWVRDRRCDEERAEEHPSGVPKKGGHNASAVRRTRLGHVEVCEK